MLQRASLCNVYLGAFIYATYFAVSWNPLSVLVI